MSAHQYAIKHNGKTLGVRDHAHLDRLIRSGQIDDSHRVFVLAQKRWMKAADLLAPFSTKQTESAMNRPVARVVSPSISTPEPSGMDDLFDDVVERTNEFSEAELSPINGVLHNLSETQTICKMQAAQENEPHKPLHQVAAKVPNPEGEWQDRRPAFLVAVLALVVGLAVGFFGSSYFKNIAPQGESTSYLQAINTPESNLPTATRP